MEKTVFEKHLIEATEAVVPFTREMVFNKLPSEYLYLIYPNQSYDGNPLEDDEIVYPAESLPTGQYFGPFTQIEAINYLWREGKVPEWINISVYSANDQFTNLELICCGRFTGLKKHL